MDAHSIDAPKSNYRYLAEDFFPRPFLVTPLRNDCHLIPCSAECGGKPLCGALITAYYAGEIIRTRNTFLSLGPPPGGSIDGSRFQSIVSKQAVDLRVN